MEIKKIRKLEEVEIVGNNVKLGLHLSQRQVTEVRIHPYFAVAQISALKPVHKTRVLCNNGNLCSQVKNDYEIANTAIELSLSKLSLDVEKIVCIGGVFCSHENALTLNNISIRIYQGSDKCLEFPHHHPERIIRWPHIYCPALILQRTKNGWKSQTDYCLRNADWNNQTVWQLIKTKLLNLPRGLSKKEVEEFRNYAEKYRIL